MTARSDRSSDRPHEDAVRGVVRAVSATAVGSAAKVLDIVGRATATLVNGLHSRRP